MFITDVLYTRYPTEQVRYLTCNAMTCTRFHHPWLIFVYDCARANRLIKYVNYAAVLKAAKLAASALAGVNAPAKIGV